MIRPLQSARRHATSLLPRNFASKNQIKLSQVYRGYEILKFEESFETLSIHIQQLNFISPSVLGRPDIYIHMGSCRHPLKFITLVLILLLVLLLGNISLRVVVDSLLNVRYRSAPSSYSGGRLRPRSSNIPSQSNLRRKWPPCLPCS